MISGDNDGRISSRASSGAARLERHVAVAGRDCCKPRPAADQRQRLAAPPWLTSPVKVCVLCPGVEGTSTDERCARRGRSAARTHGRQIAWQADRKAGKWSGGEAGKPRRSEKGKSRLRLLFPQTRGPSDGPTHPAGLKPCRSPALDRPAWMARLGSFALLGRRSTAPDEAPQRGQIRGPVGAILWQFYVTHSKVETYLKI